MANYKLEIEFSTLHEDDDADVYALLQSIAYAFGSVSIPAHDHHGIGVALRRMVYTEIQEK